MQATIAIYFLMRAEGFPPVTAWELALFYTVYNQRTQA